MGISDLSDLEFRGILERLPVGGLMAAEGVSGERGRGALSEEEGLLGLPDTDGEFVDGHAVAPRAMKNPADVVFLDRGVLAGSFSGAGAAFAIDLGGIGRNIKP